MTISTTVGTEPTIATLVKRAYQLCGTLESSQDPTSADAALGRELLDLILNDFAADGVFARAVDFTFLALDGDSSTYKYTLDSAILDVLGDAAYIPADQTDTERASSETLIKQITREQWHSLGDHSATGTPSMMYIHRANAQLEVSFYPIPDEAGNVRLQTHMKLADTYDSSATLDLEEYWTSAVLFELAFQLGMAKSVPAQTLSMLKQQAESRRERAKGKANPRGNGQFFVAHTTGWER